MLSSQPGVSGGPSGAGDPVRGAAHPVAPTGTGATDACIPQALAGDDDAFARLYRDINPRLLRYAAMLVGQDAEDVVSESWLQIARDLPRFRGGLTELRAWTARIVRNRSMDLVRATGRRPVHAEDLSVVIDRPSPDDTAAAAAETISTGQAVALIATLPPAQAEAVLLRVVFGLDPAAAGKILGRRPGAVRTATHRGLAQLAVQLRPTQADDHA
ncbi:RNA polymerase sigma factor [uncultured Jatrophihabitans sp.]|uniref:RNA polymerase sigma factor n=1 Tax=uncultured Jatrophihabitans sp. TaxID=1610747 RepID=UPI0035C9F079